MPRAPVPLLPAPASLMPLRPEAPRSACCQCNACSPGSMTQERFRKVAGYFRQLDVKQCSCRIELACQISIMLDLIGSLCTLRETPNMLLRDHRQQARSKSCRPSLMRMMLPLAQQCRAGQGILHAANMDMSRSQLWRCNFGLPWGYRGF